MINVVGLIVCAVWQSYIRYVNIYEGVRHCLFDFITTQKIRLLKINRLRNSQQKRVRWYEPNFFSLIIHFQTLYNTFQDTKTLLSHFLTNLKIWSFWNMALKIFFTHCSARMMHHFAMSFFIHPKLLHPKIFLFLVLQHMFIINHNLLHVPLSFIHVIIMVVSHSQKIFFFKCNIFII